MFGLMLKLILTKLIQQFDGKTRQTKFYIHLKINLWRVYYAGEYLLSPREHPSFAMSINTEVIALPS